MMNRNKLSVYLIRNGITEIEDIFDENLQLDVLCKYSEQKCAYYIPSIIHSPKWLKEFFELDNCKLYQANSKVILILKREYKDGNRLFAVTFGYAKNMFKEDVLEEQFGLKILLNSVDEYELRKISKINIGGNQKQSQEQIPRKGNISEFGFDIERDLVRMVTASTKEEMFGNGMITGGDIFNVAVERNVENIEEFMDLCYEKYQKNVYKERFEWVDNIKEVKSKSMIKKLIEELISKMKKSEFDKVWLAVPEIIEWEKIHCFKYSNSNEEFDDLYIERIYDICFSKKEIDTDALKRKYVRVISNEDDTSETYKWTLYKCFIAEFELQEKTFCLNNGKWYQIDRGFKKVVETYYNSIELLKVNFIDYGLDSSVEYSEDVYNEELVKSLSGSRLIHKVGEIPYGGGQGNKIEVCDVMTSNKMLIHIKKNGGSSQLSHLFNQAAVSAEALLDKEFRKKFSKKLKLFKYNDLLNEEFISQDYTVVIAIINKYGEERPKIPFFSKVAIRYTTKAIKNMGYKVVLKNIVDKV